MSAAIAELRAVGSAVMFLTRLPVPRWVGHSDAQLARATVWFPLVGAIVGLLGGIALLAATRWWSAPVAAVLTLATTIWVTGAFHEDAWADACDGLGGGWTPEQIITIMKDSRVGAYGAIGTVVLLLLRATTLTLLISHGAVDAVRAVVVAHVLARWSSLPLIATLPYVSDASGKSRPFAGSVTGGRLAVGSLLAVGLLVTALVVNDRAAVAEVRWLADALRAVGVAVVITAGGARYLRRRLGGITGDALGAVNQLVEVSVLLALAARTPT